MTSLNLSRSEEAEQKIIQSGYTATKENCPEALLDIHLINHIMSIVNDK